MSETPRAAALHARYDELQRWGLAYSAMLTLACELERELAAGQFLGGEGMKLKPINDRIVAKRIKAEDKSAGGILLTDPEAPDQAEVLAVGPGRYIEGGLREPMSVKPGDRIIIGKHAGNVVRVDGDEWLVLREEDVFAVVNA